jgi:hypothetical protein
MRISRAYCLEESKILDIYRARALFFAQDEPRRRFEFVCSDEFCRASNATKVIGINYDKLVEGKDSDWVYFPNGSLKSYKSVRVNDFENNGRSRDSRMRCSALGPRRGISLRQGPWRGAAVDGRI